MARESFGVAIRGRRRDLRMGQSDLAERLHVSQQAVSRWERGLGLPPPQRVTQLAEALKLDEENLLRHAGYLRREPGSEPPNDADFYARLKELSDEELVALIEQAWLEHRSRRNVNRRGPPR